MIFDLNKQDEKEGLFFMFQVINESGYPAGTETHQYAVFPTESEAVDWIEELKEAGEEGHFTIRHMYMFDEEHTKALHAAIQIADTYAHLQDELIKEGASVGGLLQQGRELLRSLKVMVSFVESYVTFDEQLEEEYPTLSDELLEANKAIAKAKQ